MAGHLGDYNWWMSSLLLIVFIEQDLCVGLGEKWLGLWVPQINILERRGGGRSEIGGPLFFTFHSYIMSRGSEWDVSRHPVAILTIYFCFLSLNHSSVIS